MTPAPDPPSERETIPVRAHLSFGSDLPQRWSTWRLESRISGQAAQVAVELSLPDRPTPVPMWLLRADSATYLYPRRHHMRLPDELEGSLHLPPNTDGDPPAYVPDDLAAALAAAGFCPADLDAGTLSRMVDRVAEVNHGPARRARVTAAVQTLLTGSERSTTTVPSRPERSDLPREEA